MVKKHKILKFSLPEDSGSETEYEPSSEQEPDSSFESYNGQGMTQKAIL